MQLPDESEGWREKIAKTLPSGLAPPNQQLRFFPVGACPPIEKLFNFRPAARGSRPGSPAGAAVAPAVGGGGDAVGNPQTAS